ncbi:hypothetical protein MJN51_40545, partial [Salmonella enterica subsp. enterica serovar Kentucky]|nr:hypothetical protein [Salmonella enterica subsp. enterica serovar Kentucky]
QGKTPLGVGAFFSLGHSTIVVLACLAIVVTSMAFRDRIDVLHNRDTWDTHGGKEITVEDLMKEVVTYRHFMNASGGGVTASGG